MTDTTIDTSALIERKEKLYLWHSPTTDALLDDLCEALLALITERNGFRFALDKLNGAIGQAEESGNKQVVVLRKQLASLTAENERLKNEIEYEWKNENGELRLEVRDAEKAEEALTKQLEQAEAALSVKPTMEQFEQAGRDRDENKRLYMTSLRNVQTSVAHAADLNAQLEQHQWHGVEDELPTKDDVYLALFSTGAYWLTSFFDEGWEVANHVVTHWMPLPSPPEQEVSK